MSTTDGEIPLWDGPRNFTTTPLDHGGIALVICTLMATYTVLCFGVRLFMRATLSGPFGLDDILTGVATMFAIVQMGASIAAINNGFGKSLTLLSAVQITKAEKALYAAQLLYIVTNALTKCCAALLLARIVFIKTKVRACYAVLAASVIWGLSSFIATAVRCSDHPPWNLVQDACPDYLASWKAITAFNVLIEFALFALPIWLIWELQTTFQKKAVVVLMFGLRLPIIIAAIVRVHYISKAVGSDQPLLDGVIPFICLNIEMHYGVMAATIPTLKPFFGAFNTAWGTYDTQGVSGYGAVSRSNSVHLKSLEKRANMSNTASQIRSGTMVVQVKSGSPQPIHRTVSGSSEGSKQMIIRQTRTTVVRYEDDSTHYSQSEGDGVEYAPSRSA